MRKRFLLILVFLLLTCTQLTLPQAASPVPVTEHPRLWLTPDSVAMYRSWANDSNPLWLESLLPTAEQAKADMDAGNIQNGDTGGNAYEDYATENYAVLFAFMSLIHPDETQRADYGQRARTLLMVVMTEAAKGAAAEPFRAPEFSINDRSRWYGVGFPLTVDWIYPLLTAEDKALIRGVFLRWMEELTYAATTTSNHPEPVGVYNDPVLLADQDAVRWSGNNYYVAHMRNMGMMALAFDAADDPDGALRGYLTQATGAWLYVNDHLSRTDAAGGFGTEGFEYSPQSLGYAAQFLLALHTAGLDDPALYGQQVAFTTNPFWDDSIKAYLHSLSPARTLNETLGEIVYEPAFYGSGQDYYTPDFIELFGSLGIYDNLTGNTSRLEAIRWLQLFTPVGGAEKFADRANDPGEFHKHILYYLLFDPNAPTPADPRPNYPTFWYASGMRRLLARTDWSENAAWLTYNLSWNRVDHQSGNGNGFEFYRDGEWLTKTRVGYDFDYHSSDNLNTLTVQNDPIDRDDFRLMLWERGSQWLYSAGEPPQPTYSYTPDYLYITGDSTNLYNSEYEELRGVSHVSRSIVWLKPDIVVVYDRAVTNSDDRPKRFMLNFPAAGTVNGNQVTMTTDSGQNLFLTSLLPEGAGIAVNELQDEVSSSPAHFEFVTHRLEINGGGAANMRFLTVLEGADAGTTATTATLTPCGDAYEGALVGTTLVLFARDANTAFSGLNCALPGGVTTMYLTGLAPNTGYDVTIAADSLTVATGAALTSDSAGVVLASTTP